MIGGIKRLLNYLGIKGYCINCGSALIFDKERFEMGYGTRYECPLCDAGTPRRGDRNV